MAAKSKKAEIADTAKKPEYDVAISLCKQDVAFARKLVAQLNPGLNVFFYEDHQEKLISKSGPEEFGKIFKENSKVVVILSRDEWSESFYTDIERNSIIDRTSVKNQGYSFLFVIPIEPNQIPAWYPSTRIYADPRRFSVEELARFIEFKITELGGTIKPITFEDNVELLKKKFTQKREKKLYLYSPESIQPCTDEVERLKNAFNLKIDFIENQELPFRKRQRKCDSAGGEIILKNHRLALWINNGGGPACHSLSYQLCLQIDTNGNPIKSGVYRYNTDFNQHSGWSEEFKYHTAPPDSFKNYLLEEYAIREHYYYDLNQIITSEILIELWVNELFQIVKNDYNRLLND